jgi:hypothetical protein
MAITSSSNPAFIEATQYSTFILQNLHDGLLPNTLYRNVTDFPNGTTLNIKTIGSATIQEITEDEDITYNPIESGNIQLQISDYIGDGFYVTDIMRQDGAQVEQLLSMRASEGTRAIQETFESRFLATLDASQTQGASNSVNGFAHRFIGTGGTNQVMTEADLIDMRLAFNKANVPMNGRIALVDPIVAATFSKTIQLTSSAGIGSSGPLFQQLVKDGFDKDHQFVTDIHGWQIWTSNRLPTQAAGFDVNGSTMTRASVANIFMCVADDQCKPGMVAWRQTPSTETDRDISKGRDEFVTKTRWGDGVQRQDTLGVIYVDSALTVAN